METKATDDTYNLMSFGGTAPGTAMRKYETRPMTATNHSHITGSRYHSSLSLKKEPLQSAKVMRLSTAKLKAKISRQRVETPLINLLQGKNPDNHYSSSSLDIFKERCDTLTQKQDEINDLRKKMNLQAEDDTYDQSFADDSEFIRL